VTRFKYIPYIALNSDAPTLRIINAAPQATTIEENMSEAPPLAESVPLIGAPKAWADGFRGQGQTIAILDTGIDKAHPFLAGKVVSEACYSGSSGTAESVCPGGVTASTAAGSGIPCEFGDCFHGTHVAGIAAGQGTEFSGVARESNLISIQVFRKETSVSGCDSDTAVPDQLFQISCGTCPRLRVKRRHQDRRR
jgi:subtilisin family serine protease